MHWPNTNSNTTKTNAWPKYQRQHHKKRYMNDIPQTTDTSYINKIPETTPQNTDTSAKYSCINQLPKTTTQEQIHQPNHDKSHNNKIAEPKTKQKSTTNDTTKTSETKKIYNTSRDKPSTKNRKWNNLRSGWTTTGSDYGCCYYHRHISLTHFCDD